MGNGTRIGRDAPSEDRRLAPAVPLLGFDAFLAIPAALAERGIDVRAFDRSKHGLHWRSSDTRYECQATALFAGLADEHGYPTDDFRALVGADPDTARKAFVDHIEMAEPDLCGDLRALMPASDVIAAHLRVRLDGLDDRYRDRKAEAVERTMIRFLEALRGELPESASPVTQRRHPERDAATTRVRAERRGRRASRDQSTSGGVRNATPTANDFDEAVLSTLLRLAKTLPDAALDRTLGDQIFTVWRQIHETQLTERS